MGQYLPIVVLATLAVLFGAISLVASKLLAPRRPNTAKSAPYECGIVPSREAPERFPVSFYIIAMLFIMFDIEIIFVYPYAVSHAALGSYVFLRCWRLVLCSFQHSCMRLLEEHLIGVQLRKPSGWTAVLLTR